MLTIPIDYFRLPRYLLGGALLAMGSAFLWLAPQRGLADEPVGWTLVIVSMLLLAYRNYVEVNTTKGWIAHRTGFGIGFIRRRHGLGSIERVEIKSVTRPSSDEEDEDDLSEKTSYVVSVKSGPGGVLFEHGDMFPARFIAERVARAVNAPLQNRLFGGSSRRGPDELDQTLNDRWRGDDRFKPAPVIDATSALMVTHDGNVSELSMPVPRSALPRGVGAVAGSLLIAVIVLATFALDFPRTIPLMIAGGIAFFTFFLLARYSGRDRLRFDATTVDVRRGFVPWRQRMRIDEIEEILCHREDLVLMGDERFILIHRPPGERDRELMRQFIERQISRRQSTSAGS